MRVEGDAMATPHDGPPVPFITTDEMREVDRAMIEDYGIALVQMMENAGRCLAHLARGRFLGGDPTGRRVVVLAGTGATAVAGSYARCGSTRGGPQWR